jgi:hypothetical protein
MAAHPVENRRVIIASVIMLSVGSLACNCREDVTAHRDVMTRCNSRDRRGAARFYGLRPCLDSQIR